MLIANIQNPVPVDYREAFPNTSFSTNGPNDEFLAEHGYAKVSVFRTHDSKTQKLIPSEPVFEDGLVYTVAVAYKTPEELQADSDLQAAKVRVQRNERLAESDWTQLADAPVDSLGWATYRQALRDVTKQSGFPFEIIWPTEPN
jgi:hypothetical protein